MGNSRRYQGTHSYNLGLHKYFNTRQKIANVCTNSINSNLTKVV